MASESILVYLMRRDLRSSDNPILYRLSTTQHGFTHLLPVYILPPDQIEVSGLVKDGKLSPYPPARYDLSHRWKCGPLRAKFIAESLWDLKQNLENLGSDLVIRVGTFDGVLSAIIEHYAANQLGPQVTAVWMTEDYSPGQQKEEEAVSDICGKYGIKFDLVYDVNLQLPEAETGIDCLPNSIDLFCRALTDKGEKPFDPLPLSARSSLPAFPDHASLPPQESPFEIPSTLEELIQKMTSPVQLPVVHLDRPELGDTVMPQTALGGETRGQERVRYIIKKGIASSYHLLSDDVHGGDDHHGLQSYLALGCITARQVHQELLKLECGTDPDLGQTLGFGRGCNAGTESIRYHLLVLNFIRLSIIKYGSELCNLQGAGPGKNPFKTWKSSVIRHLERPGQAVDNAISMTQFSMGLTGFGLVDAIMRQLHATGQVTPRGEEIAMGFFALYAGFDWRYGAEYVSSLSTVHDPFFYFYSSQKHAGVGPSCAPRGSTVSPAEVSVSLAEVSQQLDPNGIFIRRWVPELRSLRRRKYVYRVSTTASSLLQQHGLASSLMVTHEVPCAMDTTTATRDQMESTAALSRRADRPALLDTISEREEFEELGLRRQFQDQIPPEAPLGLGEPNELPQGPPLGQGGPSLGQGGPSLPFRPDRGTPKAQVASTMTGASAPPAEATVRRSGLALEHMNPLGLHPVRLSSQSSHTAGLPPLRPQVLPVRVEPHFLPYRQQSPSESSSPGHQQPLPAAPTPPPPPPPAPSSAIPHHSNIPRIPLPQHDIPRASIESHYQVIMVTPRRPRPSRLQSRIAVIPHPALAGFLPVVAEPEIIRYYIGQLRQPTFWASSNYRFIDLPFLDYNRIHIIPCPRGVVPLRGDPDFREPWSSVPEDIDLEALDELIDEVDDDEVAVLGPRFEPGPGGSLSLRHYRRRQPSRFNSRYR
ncbi:photolyase [Trichoderma sp. SZMC 28014]